MPQRKGLTESAVPRGNAIQAGPGQCLHCCSHHLGRACASSSSCVVFSERLGPGCQFWQGDTKHCAAIGVGDAVISMCKLPCSL